MYNEDKKWKDIEERKNGSMSNLNSSNNAAILVAAGIKPTEENLEMFKRWKDEIYQLNLQ